MIFCHVFVLLHLFSTMAPLAISWSSITLDSISSWYLLIWASSSASLAVVALILCKSATSTAISAPFLSASILLSASSIVLSSSSSSIAWLLATIIISISLSLTSLAS